jgi:hypothetical protein
MSIRSIERYQMDTFERIIKSKQFKSDLEEIEKYIQTIYQTLHYHWGIKNKLKLAAESLDIKVLDHLIVAEKTYFSFADESLL